MREKDHSIRRSPTPPANTTRGRFEVGELWWVAGAVMLVLVVGYWPIWQAGFVWDDDLILTNNPLIKASDGLRRFWFSTEPQDYWPVVSTSFWVEWRLFGMHAIGYHAVNLGLHGVASMLVWRIVKRLQIPGAGIAAVLFAIHPVNVESVAWITQLKNTLSMVFFLLSIDWYLRGEEGCEPSRDLPWWPSASSWYTLSLAAFVLAMLSKGSVAMLPALILGLIAWRRPPTRRDVLRLAPFFAVAVILIKVNIWFQTHGSAALQIRNDGWLERGLGAGAVVWFYLGKALWPANLIFVYPQWRIESGDFFWWLPVLGLAVVLAWLVWYRRSWTRPVLFALGFFVVALVPVMGFTNIYFMKYSLVADHYQHIALLAVVTLAGAGWSVWCQRHRPLAWVGLMVGLATLTVLTWRQTRLYHDVETLYRDTLARNPDCLLVQNNLGVLLMQKNPDEAIAHFQAALRLKPDDSDAHLNLGTVFANLGRRPEALVEYREGVRLSPNQVEARINYASVLRASGDLPEAIRQLEKAVEVDGSFVPAHYNLANALLQAGRFAEAVGQYLIALKLQP